MRRDEAIQAMAAAVDAVCDAYGWQPGDPMPVGEAFLDALTEAGYALVKTAPPGGDPMPVFVVKGKDRLAVGAVAGYRLLCIDHDLYDQAAHVGAALAEIRQWQARHPDLVQMPDHPHVPAADQGGHRGKP